MWVVYYERKNKLLQSTPKRIATFDECIYEIGYGNFLIIHNHSKKHADQKCFFVSVNDYPIILPFRERGEVIQLITLFPDRRYKDGR